MSDKQAVICLVILLVLFALVGTIDYNAGV